LRSTNGQTLAEYALILAFISVVAIGTLMAMGGKVTTTYTTVSQQLNVASSGGPSAANSGSGGSSRSH
jgi:Flp pilus assembly pilin Flp